MVEFLQQNGLLVLIGCLVLLLLFFMIVAAAAIFVARLSGRSLLGPVLGSMLRTMSVKGEADNEDIEERAKPPPHRHFDVNQIKAQSTDNLDFEQAVEKYRGQDEPPEQEQSGSYTAEVLPAPQRTLPLTPLVAPSPSDSPELPLTPIAPPPPEPLVPPPGEPPAHPLGAGGGGFPTPESGFSPLPPRPPTLPGQRLDDATS